MNVCACESVLLESGNLLDNNYHEPKWRACLCVRRTFRLINIK